MGFPVRTVLVAFTLAALGRATAAEPATRTFEITASRFHFVPAVIEVEAGEHVVLHLHSTDTDHGLEIKALKAKVTIPEGGQVVTLEFDAPAAGSYVFKCSEYCGKHHDRMRGELVVREKATP